MSIGAAAILIKGTCTLSIALATASAMRNRPASLRHLVLALGFGSLLAIPLVAAVGPSIAVTLPVVRGITDVPVPGQAVPRSASQQAAPVTVLGELSAATGATAPRYPLPTIAAAVWITGTLIVLLPMVIGAFQARRLWHHGLSWPHGRKLATLVARELGIRRRVRFRLVDAGPAALGVLHPTVLFPYEARGWDRVDVRRALIHELEHIRRGDCLVHVAARVICAIYWFHPLVWVAWRRLGLEAERACDDVVVGLDDARAYAEQLVALAERGTRRGRQPVLAMAGRHDLLDRVSSILAAGRPRGRIGWSTATAVTVCAGVLTAAIAPLKALQPDATAHRGIVSARPPVASRDIELGRARTDMGREADARGRTSDVIRSVAPSVESPRRTVQAPDSTSAVHTVVPQPDVSLQASQSQSPSAVPQPAADQTQDRTGLAPDQERQLEEAIASGRTWTDLSLSLSTSFRQLNRAEYAVPITVRIAPLPELAVGRGEHSRLDVVAVITDFYGYVFHRFRDRMDLTLDAAAIAALARTPITYETEVIALPGRYTLRVLVRDQTTGRIGTSEIEFTIPNLDRERQAR